MNIQYWIFFFLLNICKTSLQAIACPLLAFFCTTEMCCNRGLNTIYAPVLFLHSGFSDYHRFTATPILTAK